MVFTVSDRLKEYVKIVHRNLNGNDYDEVLVISGEEGMGKSTIALHIVHEYLELLKGSVRPEDLRENVGLDLVEFATLLKEKSKGGIADLDEAAEISSRTSMSARNVVLMQAYQLIRGQNLFTILTIPSVFDLDRFFRNRRVRHYIHVHKRGKFGFWSKERYRAMVALNDTFVIKNPFIIPPSFTGSFHRYEGPMIKPYLEAKASKIGNVRDELVQTILELKKGGKRVEEAPISSENPGFSAQIASPSFMEF